MPKLINRIVAFLLVPCLIVDPALAQFKVQKVPELWTLNSGRFSEQALSGVIVSEIVPSVSRRDKLSVIGWEHRMYSVLKKDVYGLSMVLWPGKLMVEILKGSWSLVQAMESDEWAFLKTECERAYNLAQR